MKLHTLARIKMFSVKVFTQFFEQVPNNADGNCLFESMEYLLKNSMYAAITDYDPPCAGKIRSMVGKFYREFDKDIEYNETTIEYTIKLGCLFDNIDDYGVAHDSNIVNDKVWASMTDVLICSLLFEVNINLYKYDEENRAFTLEKITSQYDFPETVNLMYNGKNHFEAIVKKHVSKKRTQRCGGGGSKIDPFSAAALRGQEKVSSASAVGGKIDPFSAAALRSRSTAARRSRSGAFDITANSMIAMANRERFTPKKMNYYMALMMEN